MKEWMGGDANLLSWEGPSWLCWGACGQGVGLPAASRPLDVFRATSLLLTEPVCVAASLVGSLWAESQGPPRDITMMA